MQEAVRQKLRVEELTGDQGDPIDPNDPEAGLVTNRRSDDDVSPSYGPHGELLVPLVVSPAQSEDKGVRFVSVSDQVSTTILGITSSDGQLLTYSYKHSWDCPSVVGLEFDVNEHGATILAEEHPLVQITPPWAIDAQGDDVPTWYEADGSTLIQVVDARNAVAPIVFV